MDAEGILAGRVGLACVNPQPAGSASNLSESRPVSLSVYPERADGSQIHVCGILGSSGPLFRSASALISTVVFLALIGCGRQNQSGNPEGSNKQQAAPAAEVTVVSIAPKIFPLRLKPLGKPKARYDNGYSSYLEVLDAQRNLFSAELQQVQLQRARLGAIVNLYKALGGDRYRESLEP